MDLDLGIIFSNVRFPFFQEIGYHSNMTLMLTYSLVFPLIQLVGKAFLTMYKDRRNVLRVANSIENNLLTQTLVSCNFYCNIFAMQ